MNRFLTRLIEALETPDLPGEDKWTDEYEQQVLFSPQEALDIIGSIIFDVEQKEVQWELNCRSLTKIFKLWPDFDLIAKETIGWYFGFDTPHDYPTIMGPLDPEKIQRLKDRFDRVCSNIDPGQVQGLLHLTD